MNKSLLIISLVAMLASLLIMAGCPINEEDDEKETPKMNCKLAMKYVYNTCDIAYNDTSGEGSQALSLEQATEQCKEWEDTEDWNDSFWECIVDCADDYRLPDECDSFKTCESKC